MSKHYPGAVVTVSIEPTIEFNELRGRAASTRRQAAELWGNRLPVDHYEKLARIREPLVFSRDQGAVYLQFLQLSADLAPSSSKVA